MPLVYVPVRDIIDDRVAERGETSELPSSFMSRTGEFKYAKYIPYILVFLS
jgi:hypothetical protein